MQKGINSSPYDRCTVRQARSRRPFGICSGKGRPFSRDEPEKRFKYFMARLIIQRVSTKHAGVRFPGELTEEQSDLQLGALFILLKNMLQVYPRLVKEFRIVHPIDIPASPSKRSLCFSDDRSTSALSREISLMAVLNCG